MPSLTTRQICIINRVLECVNSLDPFKDDSTWEEYMSEAKSLTEELLHACAEWEKYYNETETKQWIITIYI